MLLNYPEGVEVELERYTNQILICRFFYEEECFSKVAVLKENFDFQKIDFMFRHVYTYDRELLIDVIESRKRVQSLCFIAIYFRYRNYRENCDYICSPDCRDIDSCVTYLLMKKRIRRC